MEKKVITASEFARHFGRYRVESQRSPIPISHHGEVSGFYIAKDDLLELLKKADRPPLNRKVFRTEDAPEKMVERMREMVIRMRTDPQYDATLDEEGNN